MFAPLFYWKSLLLFVPCSSSLGVCVCVCVCVCMFPQKQYIEKARQHMLAMKRKRVSLDIRTQVCMWRYCHSSKKESQNVFLFYCFSLHHPTIPAYNSHTANPLPSSHSPSFQSAIQDKDSPDSKQSVDSLEDHDSIELTRAAYPPPMEVSG